MKCVICKKSKESIMEAEYVFRGMSICKYHFDEILRRSEFEKKIEEVF